LTRPYKPNLPDPLANAREPIFNLPAAMVAGVAILTAIHVLRSLLPFETDLWVLFTFAFVPARYISDSLIGLSFPGGAGADLWTFLTYALLHGSWMHLGVNVAWMVAFGTPVLRRFGTVRFVLLSAVAAIAGAGAHLLTHWGEFAPVVGASAAISGQMGAAVRFAFQHPASIWSTDPDARWKQPALPLARAFHDMRVLAFVAIWFAVNYAFGATGMAGDGDASVAWEAHIGGFLTGLLGFRLFDPAASPRQDAPFPDQNNGS
jgi:membrane associated rhomboid family serine protease